MKPKTHPEKPDAFFASIADILMENGTAGI